MVGVRSTLHSVLAERGVDASKVDPWFFPTPEVYSAILRKAGFRVESCGACSFTAARFEGLAHPYCAQSSSRALRLCRPACEAGSKPSHSLSSTPSHLKPTAEP